MLSIPHAFYSGRFCYGYFRALANVHIWHCHPSHCTIVWLSMFTIIYDNAPHPVYVGTLSMAVVIEKQLPKTFWFFKQLNWTICPFLPPRPVGENYWKVSHFFPGKGKCACALSRKEILKECSTNTLSSAYILMLFSPLDILLSCRSHAVAPVQIPNTLSAFFSPPLVIIALIVLGHLKGQSDVSWAKFESTILT